MVTRYANHSEMVARVNGGTANPALLDMEASFESEFANRGTLWVGEIDGVVAATQWCVRGRDLPKWYIALKPSDIVIYAISTFDEFRGRGIQPAMMRYIIENEPRGDGDFYCDVFIWNTVALKNTEKVGYRRFASARAK